MMKNTKNINVGVMLGKLGHNQNIEISGESNGVRGCWVSGEVVDGVTDVSTGNYFLHLGIQRPKLSNELAVQDSAPEAPLLLNHS